MVKALELMKKQGITRVKCTAHTLQLVVGKGLIPAQVLVARTKRLLSFFIVPKQSERLEDAQRALLIPENKVIFIYYIILLLIILIN